MDFRITPEQRAQLLADAERIEAVARSLRNIASFGRPSPFDLDAAPTLQSWRWDHAERGFLRGDLLLPGNPSISESSTGDVILNTPDFSAVLTTQGWFKLGVPADEIAPSTSRIQ